MFIKTGFLDPSVQLPSAQLFRLLVGNIPIPTRRQLTWRPIEAQSAPLIGPSVGTEEAGLGGMHPFITGVLRMCKLSNCKPMEVVWTCAREQSALGERDCHTEELCSDSIQAEWFTELSQPHVCTHSSRIKQFTQTDLFLLVLHRLL